MESESLQINTSAPMVSSTEGAAEALEGPSLDVEVSIKANGEAWKEDDVGLELPQTDAEVPVAPGIDERLRCIEEHNQTIQDQLTATQQMIQTLTDLVHTLQLQSQPPPGPLPPQPHDSPANLPPASPVVSKLLPLVTSSASPNTEEAQAKILPASPGSSHEDHDVMTRTISLKGVPVVDDSESDDVVAPLTLASAVSVMRKIARAASRKTLRVPEMVMPMMTRRFSVSTLDFTSKRDSHLRRIALWSRTVFAKPRIEPRVTKREIIEARQEDKPTSKYTIAHDSAERLAWDVLVMVAILIDIVVTPVTLSFDFNPHGLNTFNALATVVFATDFVIQAFSSYITKRGAVMSGPKNTIPHYLLSTWALADFLSWFPFEYLVSSDQGRFLGVAKVIRLVKISQLARRFHSSKKAGIFRLLRLLTVVFLVSHVLACYWNWVAAVWRVNEEGYLSKPLSAKYSHCWSLVIGSLNASPPAMYTPIEEISVSVFMLIGNVIQASVFGSVAVLISSFDEEEVAYNKKLIDTYERCKLLDIPDQLADRIRTYYEHLYRETHSVDPDADAFINELSPALICEVKFQLYRDMVKQIPFFSASTINPVVIEMLILRLRTVIYMQDDVLIRKGEFGDWMGFIGSKGSVGVLDPNSDMRRIIRILKKGDYFGEMGLLHHTKRTTTTVALSWVQVHVLNRGDLDQVKSQYSEEAESMEEEIKVYLKSRVDQYA